MYLKILNSGSKIVIEKNQKDYDLYEGDSIDVFIYGYPFYKGKWVNSNFMFKKLILNFNYDFYNKLEGVYSIVILDRKLNECIIITDRYGIYTLFYYKTDHSIIISDKIKTILGFMDEIKINKKEILERLTFGYMNRIGCKTHIEGIKEFRGSCIYTIKDGSIKDKNYWEYPITRKNADKDSFLREFNSHILTGFNLEKRKIFTLTGGLDTRTILSSVIDRADELECSTYGIKKCKDIKISKKITNQFNIKHHLTILNKDYIMNIPELIKNNVDMFNGLTSMAFQTHLYGFCEENRNNGELLFLGMGGDEIWRGNHIDANKIKGLNMDDTIDAILNKNIIKKNKTLNVFKGLKEDDVKEILRNSIKKELINCPDIFDSIMVFDYFNIKFYYANWMSNLIKFCGQYFKIFLGLVNKDLLSSLRYINLSYRSSGSLQKYIIKENCPELAEIIYCHDRFNDSKSVNIVIMKIIHKIKFFINRVSHRLFNFNLFKYFPDLPHYYWVWLPKYHKQFILDILNYENMITKSLFNKEELQKIVKLFLKSDYSVKSFVISLISLEIWLKSISKNKKIIL